MRGIILAGGSGSRLHPLTLGTSKQLLPVYDKPMIYYPISTLMLAGIQEILVITTPHESSQFKRLLGDGSQWGVSISYATQQRPEGLAQALIIGEEFLEGQPCALILGDNIFFGPGMGTSLERMKSRPGATIFAYAVEDSRNYGVVELDQFGRVLSLEEKPKHPKSKLAVPGLYFFDGRASQFARKVELSERGEYEITSLNMLYFEHNQLHAEFLDANQTWLDAGTIDSLRLAANIVFSIEETIGKKINVPEEVAWRKGYISTEQLLEQAEKYPKSGYGDYLRSLT
jgi:glucose-1-phosphate thymidylyltransferase